MNKLLKFFLLVFSITQAIALGSTSLVSAQPATGAVISNIDENGIDQGNLSITTNTLEIQDLQDTDQSKTTGGGFNISGNGDNLELSSTYASKDKQGTSKATIGQGSITVNNEQDQAQLALLNRDINNTQETTRDWETERVDTTLKIDTRVFTPEGWKSIKNDFVKTAEGLQKLGGFIKETYSLVAEKLAELTTPEEQVNFVDNLSDAERAALIAGGITDALLADRQLEEALRNDPEVKDLFRELEAEVDNQREKEGKKLISQMTQAELEQELSQLAEKGATTEYSRKLRDAIYHRLQVRPEYKAWRDQKQNEVHSESHQRPQIARCNRKLEINDPRSKARLYAEVCGYATEDSWE